MVQLIEIMDEAAREVLRTEKKDIKKNLNLDDGILDTLEARDTLTTDLVQTIKAERTNSEKISSLLFILQRRGPDAFKQFIDAVSVDSLFLAERLLHKYDAQLKKQDAGNSSEHSPEPSVPLESHPMETSHTAKPIHIPIPTETSESVKQVDSTQDELSNALNVPTSPNVNLPPVSPHVCPNCNHVTNRIHQPNFTPGHFPQVYHPIRRLSNQSLDCAVHPTGHFIQAHHSLRRLSSHSIDFASHQCLNGMYTKLKIHLNQMNERELSFGTSPVPVTFEMVEELLDKLLKIEQNCYTVLGTVNRTSLVTHIIDIKEAKKQLQKNLNKKEEQTQKYAGKILKLETKCKDIESTLKRQNNITETLKAENQKLQDEKDALKHEINESVQLVNNTREAEPYLKHMESKNEEMRNRISRYEKEMELMQMKLAAYHKQGKHDAAAIIRQAKHDAEVDNEDIRSAHADNINSMPSTLQDCRDLCIGNNKHTMSQMSTKILFAGVRRTGNKRTRDLVSNGSSGVHEMITTGDEKRKGKGVGDTYDKQRAQYGPTNHYETMAKLSTRYSNGASPNVPKQKSPEQNRKSLMNKGLKKHPPWNRKPLK